MELVLTVKKNGRETIQERRPIGLAEAFEMITQHLNGAGGLSLGTSGRLRLQNVHGGDYTFRDLLDTDEELAELVRFCELWKSLHARRKALHESTWRAKAEAARKTSPKPEMRPNQASARRGLRGTAATNATLKQWTEDEVLRDLSAVSCAALAYLGLFSDDYIEPFHLLQERRLLELVLHRMTTPECTIEDLRILAT